MQGISMKRLFLSLIILVFLCGCNVTYVEVKKYVFIYDGENMVEITGSELKDNTANQSADGTLDIPLVK